MHAPQMILNSIAVIKPEGLPKPLDEAKLEK
jgi:hypothetical protein